MPAPIPLGFFSLCLKTANLDRTPEFYKKIGFRPVGEDAPGLRVSLANGTDALTFMTFLDVSLINFRGASIHAVSRELMKRGFAIEDHNTFPDTQFMLDENGRPLPDNECGHFTVRDPDGNVLFFNTHPDERQPFEDALEGEDPATGLLKASAADTDGGEPVLGRLLYRLNVKDLRASVAFYENLGLSILGGAGGSATMGPRNPRRKHGGIYFMLRLLQTKEPGSTLLFCCEEPVRVADSIRAGGIEVVSSPEGPFVTDPDGRALLIVDVKRNPILV